jgi:hypothetical protein
MYHTETKTSRFCLRELENQIHKIGVSKPEMFRMNAPRDRRLCIQKGGLTQNVIGPKSLRAYALDCPRRNQPRRQDVGC